jgi:hypothetical protein
MRGCCTRHPCTRHPCTRHPCTYVPGRHMWSPCMQKTSPNCNNMACHIHRNGCTTAAAKRASTDDTTAQHLNTPHRQQHVRSIPGCILTWPAPSRSCSKQAARRPQCTPQPQRAAPSLWRVCHCEIAGPARAAQLELRGSRVCSAKDSLARSQELRSQHPTTLFQHPKPASARRSPSSPPAEHKSQAFRPAPFSAWRRARSRPPSPRAA